MLDKISKRRRTNYYPSLFALNLSNNKNSNASKFGIFRDIEVKFRSGRVKPT